MRNVLNLDLLSYRVFLQVLDRTVLVLLCHLHPELCVPIRLVCQQGLCYDCVEYDLPLHCEEGSEDSPSPLLRLEGVDVRGHQTLQERLRVGPPDRYDLL